MDKKDKILILEIFALIILAFGVAAILNSLHTFNPTQIFWMCYISLIIIGIGILTKNSFLIMSQVYILIIPVLVWDIDFLYHLIFQQPLLGMTDYFFYERTFNLGKLISLQHLFAVPIAIYSAKLIGLKRRDAWKMSFVQIVLVFLAVSLFTLPENNINCVFQPCGDFPLFGIPYRLAWFAVFFMMTFVASFLVNGLFFKKSKKSREKNSGGGI